MLLLCRAETANQKNSSVAKAQSQGLHRRPFQQCFDVTRELRYAEIMTHTGRDFWLDIKTTVTCKGQGVKAPAIQPLGDPWGCFFELRTAPTREVPRQQRWQKHILQWTSRMNRSAPRATRQQPDICSSEWPTTRYTR